MNNIRGGESVPCLMTPSTQASPPFSLVRKGMYLSFKKYGICGTYDDLRVDADHIDPAAVPFFGSN